MRDHSLHTPLPWPRERTEWGAFSPPPSLPANTNSCTQKFGFRWRGACSPLPHPHLELPPHQPRPRAERSQSWLAASPHLTGPHSPGALPPRTHNGISTVTLPEHCQRKREGGRKEGASVSSRAHAQCVCMFGVERGCVHVSQYETGSDTGRRQPALRDNQAQAAIEGEARLQRT